MYLGTLHGLATVHGAMVQRPISIKRKSSISSMSLFAGTKLNIDVGRFEKNSCKHYSISYTLQPRLHYCYVILNSTVAC